MPFPFVLFTVFLVLKLTGVINWAWFWVFTPLLVQVAALTVVSIVTVLTQRRIRRDFEEHARRFRGRWP